MFIDNVTVGVCAGNGGDGAISFRREKFVPRGGPDGGDGGNGGSIIIVAREKIPHLQHIRPNFTYSAEHGKAGGKSRKFGRGGEDTIIEAPVGTTVTDTETGELLADLLENGQKFCVAKGGHGGRGNVHFATPTNRVPHKSDPGTEGEERRVRMELFIPADVVLVGFPYSGKSSLHRSLTGSRSDHGGFEFSTRQPRLGVCVLNEYTRFKLLDMPSVCEGASEGQGLGNKFLRHLRRPGIIVFVLDPVSKIALEQQLEIAKSEISAYNPAFLEKKQFVVISKIDMIKKPRKSKKADAAGEVKKDPTALKINNTPIFRVSSETGDGTDEFKQAIAAALGLEES